MGTVVANKISPVFLVYQENTWQTNYLEHKIIILPTWKVNIQRGRHIIEPNIRNQQWNPDLVEPNVKDRI